MTIPESNLFDIIICGCGPTGALLSTYLCRLGVRHVILEREPEITTDPRGIVLDEDGIRIMQGVGLYRPLFDEVGKPMNFFRFIEGGRGLHVQPFIQFDYSTIEGGTGHPGFLAQKQPALEKHLQRAINNKYGELRSLSTVINIEEDANSVSATYLDNKGISHTVQGKFLVGADGKTGFVRKKYLEPKGILMENNPKFRYNATWVALNWHLTLPTPETHPDFPLWHLGYSPEAVYDLFFPIDFNFICDPARPSVCGRFGRTEDRLWRFEFVVKSDENGDQMATQEQAKKIIFPYLTHSGKDFGLSADVAWPEDCIEWIRSRPFSFSARSCTEWSLGRIVLAGDAAHVFPPFGGQGIVSGFRDAISLSWRLKVAINPACKNFENLLRGWYTERKQQLERSLASTVENGNFCNEPSRVKAFVRNWYLWAVQLVPAWKHNLQLGGRRDGMTRYTYTSGVPFLPQFDGGKSLPQVFSAPIDGPAPTIPSFTDDTIFAPQKAGVFQIVAILSSTDQLSAARAELKRIPKPDSIVGLDLEEATFLIHGLSASVAPETVALLGQKGDPDNIIRVVNGDEYTEAGLTEAAVASKFPRPPPKFYNPDRIREHLGHDKKYVIVRWDRMVFASCANAMELQTAIDLLEGCVNPDV